MMQFTRGGYKVQITSVYMFGFKIAAYIAITEGGVYKRTLVGVYKRTQVGVYKLLNSTFCSQMVSL